MPKTIEDYVHQVGRAGRLQTQGFVMAFINKSNKNIFLSLQELCLKSGTKLPEELVNSLDFRKVLENPNKKDIEKTKALKRNKSLNEDINQKSLLEILTKHPRR